MSCILRGIKMFGGFLNFAYSNRQPKNTAKRNFRACVVQYVMSTKRTCNA